MTGAELTLTLNSISEHLRICNYTALAERFECPLPFYADECFVLMRSRSEIEEALRTFGDLMRDKSIHRIEPTILRVEDRSATRALVVVRWDHFDHSGRLISNSKVRYVVRRGADANPPRIELVEYLEIAIPGMSDRLFHAKA